MDKLTKKEKIYKGIGLFCAIFIFLLSFLFLISWHFNLLKVIQPSWLNWPMPYVANICVLLASLSLLFLYIPPAHKVCNWLGALIFLIGLERILEIIFHINWLNELSIKLLSYSPNTFPPIAGIGAISFLFLGYVLLIWPRNHMSLSCNNILFTFSFLLLIIGLLGSLSYIIPIKSTFGWEEQIPIHLYTSIILFFIGLGLLATLFYYNLRFKITFSKWIPFAVTTGLIFFNTMLSLGLKEEEKSKILTNTIFYLFLLGGAILSMCMGLLIHVWQIAGERLSLAKKTEAKRAELASIVLYAPDGMYTADINGIIQTWNKGAENIYQWTKEEIIGQSVKKTYPSNRLHEFKMIKEQLEKGQSIIQYQTQRMRKDSTLLWVNNTYSMIPDAFGNLAAVSVITQDITRSKELDDLLKKEQERFRAFVEATEEWIWEVDKAGCFTYSNLTIQKILGFTPNEIQGKLMLDFLTEQDREHFSNEMQSYIKKKIKWPRRLFSWKNKDGTIIYLEGSAEPILDNNHNFLGFRGADRDVTERVKMERAKDQFISIVSHEIRTPLASIQGALGLLSIEGAVSEKIKDLITIAYRNSKRLMHITNDILDVEKIQLGSFKVQKKPLILLDAVKEGIRASEPLANEHQIAILQKDMLPNIQILGDLDRLIQVMINLLSNAIKFSSPKEKIIVSMQDRSTTVRVLIQDYGKGIAPEFRKKIFFPFAQVDQSDTRIAEGTGLGLNICKSIIEKLDGTIDFTSVEGKGSTFYFDLPIV